MGFSCCDFPGARFLRSFKFTLLISQKAKFEAKYPGVGLHKLLVLVKTSETPALPRHLLLPAPTCALDKGGFPGEDTWSPRPEMIGHRTLENLIRTEWL